MITINASEKIDEITNGIASPLGFNKQSNYSDTHMQNTYRNELPFHLNRIVYRFLCAERYAKSSIVVSQVYAAQHICR